VIVRRNTIRRRRRRVKLNDLIVASGELNRRNLNTDPRRPTRAGQRVIDTTLACQTHPCTVLVLGYHLPRRETRPIQCKSLLDAPIHSTTSQTSQGDLLSMTESGGGVGGSCNPVADSSDVELLDDAVTDDLDENLSLAPSYSRASRSVSVRGAGTAVEDNNTSSLADSDSPFAVLREALWHRNFENLGHEPNEFSQFMVAKDLALLNSYNSFDSIQTVAIKLIVRHAKASLQGIKSAVKGLSSLSSTNANATIFTREKPPIRKEPSRVFNRFTMSFTVLHVDHSVQRAKSIINNAKRFVDFRNADLDSRKAPIRAAMAFGMLLRYHGLPMDEVVRCLNEMGGVILDDYRVLGRSVAKKEFEQLLVLCGMLLGCSSSIAVNRGFAGGDEPEEVT